MPSKIQGRLCANNTEAIQSLNVAVEQLSEQLHEVHLNPMFTEILRQLQDNRAKLASRDAEVERLVERVTRLERNVVELQSSGVKRESVGAALDRVEARREAMEHGETFCQSHHIPVEDGKCFACAKILEERRGRAEKHAQRRELIRRRT